jgi:hypothetical protein
VVEGLRAQGFSKNLKILTDLQLNGSSKKLLTWFIHGSGAATDVPTSGVAALAVSTIASVAMGWAASFPVGADFECSTAGTFSTGGVPG